MMKKIPSWCNTNSGLLVLRIGVGAIFIMTGCMKVANMTNTVSMFASMGFGTFWAYLVSAVELVGGLAVLLGIYTRFFAVLLTIVMIVAIYVLHNDIMSLMTPLTMLFSTLALTLAGAGAYSLVTKKV